MTNQVKPTIRQLVVLVLTVLVLASAAALAQANGIPVHKQLSEKELVEMFRKSREMEKQQKQKKETAAQLPPDFDENEARAARERLAAEKQKIEQLESKTQDALAKWNALTPEQREQVLKLAQDRAEQRKQQIQRDIDLSEKLLVKEGIDLEKRLDERLQKEQEEEKQNEKERMRQEREEFERKQAAHRANQFNERTTERSIVFWVATFTISALVSRLAVQWV